jgi:hypothetical protein
MELALDLSPPESKHYRSWDERLRYVARYSRPEEIHVACEMARAVGVTSVLTVLDHRTEAALREFQIWRDLSVWAVVPNMYAFIRDLTDRGMVGAAFARFLRLRPAAMVATGVNALRELGPLARADFSAGALWLAEMELAAVERLNIRRVFLHPQLTEIALAGRQLGLFAGFARRVGALGLEAGLVTHNPVIAGEVLGAERDLFAALVAPCNSEGYKMVPSREACERFLRSDRARIFASNITAAGSIDLARALDHVRTLGLAGAVLDVRTVAAAYRPRGPVALGQALTPAAEDAHAQEG